MSRRCKRRYVNCVRQMCRPSSNLEIQINSLKDALQELSLTVQVLKDKRSSYGSTNEGTPTNMATGAEVAVHETEFEALWSEIGDIRRTLQGMCQEGHGVSVSKTESHSMNQTTWRVSVDVPTMDRNYTDEALLCHSKKPSSVTHCGVHKRTQPHVNITHSTEFKRKAQHLHHTHTGKLAPHTPLSLPLYLCRYFFYKTFVYTFCGG